MTLKKGTQHRSRTGLDSRTPKEKEGRRILFIRRLRMCVSDQGGVNRKKISYLVKRTCDSSEPSLEANFTGGAEARLGRGTERRGGALEGSEAAHY
ncbi:hypothetical protein SAMN04488043_1071 [Thalassovita gelatinovora]|nr:hypothetical protein SAMN04488043_1071 [Thalassovita gelatinovora]